MIGQVLDGRYRILSQLGEGGMGEVYLAEHVNLGRKEALKILHPRLASEPQFVSRFRREARATNRVQHPNIVSVYDFGRLPDGRFYLSMEYADGQSLYAELARHGPLSVGRALHVLWQLADAVDHAHSRGVVHRDLKPENMVLVEHRGKPDVLKVLDFGIAKIVAPDYETHNLTQKGEIFGTALYMAPEQFAGVGADPRADLYAIGCIGFEVLVGEPPFNGRTMEIMHKHLTTRPDRPSARRPQAGIPPELDEVIARCLEKDPTRRFQTGRELAVALERVPGFRAGRSGSGRVRSGVHAQSDFEADTQERRFGAETVFDGDLARITERLPGDEVRHAYFAALREAAEALLDLGHNDIQLVIGVANVHQLEDDLYRGDAEMEALEARIAAEEQSAREREGALRFALGELHFERSQTVARGESPHVDVDRQIAELGQRLGRVRGELEREIGVLQDKEIALVAARATVEERLSAMYAAMGRLLDELLPRYEAQPAVASIADRLRALRAAGDTR
jgi:hypothetical protein